MSIRPSETSYRVEPLTVPCNKESTVRIFPLGKQAAFWDDSDYYVTLVPMDYQTPENYVWKEERDHMVLRPKNGVLTITYTFTEEQEWTILIARADQVESGRLRFHIYSLESDLYGLHPYCGDLHCHSARSDGKSDPAVVASYYRKAGYDFLALTDHALWEPSEEMISAYADVKLGMKLFHGEEIHPGNDYIIHMVNFGGEESVNACYKENPEKAEAEMAEIAKGLSLPYGVNPLEYARRVWVSERVRHGGGLCILPHAFWIVRDVHNMDLRMLDYSMRSGIYDAMEIMTGQTVHENNLQVCFYMEQRAKGVNIPFVGSSDSHGPAVTSLFGIVKTIVLAKSNEKKDLVEAIMARRCTAVEQNPNEEYRVWGDFRMVNYVRFLKQHYFPMHDELCVEEGRWMEEHLHGNPDAPASLEAIAGRCEALAIKLLG